MTSCELRSRRVSASFEALVSQEQRGADRARCDSIQVQRHFLTKSDSILSRSKSVYSQRNLGTIRARKIEKKQQVTSSGEMILRILRMQ